MKSIALGKYVPYDSWLHRLDPRLKIFLTIFFMVMVFLPFKTWSMTFLMGGILFLVALLLLIATRISFASMFSSLKSMWFMVVFLLVVYILVPQNINPTLGVAWNINGWVVYWDNFAQAGKIVLRLLLMLEATMVLTSSTKPLDLTYALEWYLTPLKVVRFPSAEIAMIISIALRFIPTLLEDTIRVMKAQESRGADFRHGSIFKRVKNLTSLIVPLFASSFLRSEDLAYAMEARGYDPSAKRSRYRKSKWRLPDTFALIIGLLFAAGFIYMVAAKIDLFALFGVNAL
jgi:energy-coupling factor transport system permease protein